MDSQRFCHRCGSDIGRLERVGRRDTCLKCGADLHCCRNCEFHDPTMNNQCRESQAERQVDKQAGNFCDYFAFVSGRRGAGSGSAAQAAKDKLNSLFGKKSG